MRVYCAKIINPTNDEEVAESSWVQIGKEYVVLSVLAQPTRPPSLQILTDDGTPSWWASQMFVTVSSKIPSSWIATVDDGGVLRLGPAPLLKPGFWESFFDGDPAAIATYEEERDKILNEAID